MGSMFLSERGYRKGDQDTKYLSVIPSKGVCLCVFLYPGLTWEMHFLPWAMIKEVWKPVLDN